MPSVAVARPLCWLARYLKSSVFFEHAEIQENAIRELRAITEIAFQETFPQWGKRWGRYIASRGDYVEGDSVKMLQNKICIAKVRSFFEHAFYCVPYCLSPVTSLTLPYFSALSHKRHEFWK
jgi:hypothetical protein